MQDKYAGDVGDFGKFVLLEQLLNVCEDKLRLGVNWYRVTRPEKDNSDGRHISYLDRSHPMASRFERCNPRIYSALKYLADDSKRSIGSLERSGVLPENTLFFSNPLPYGARPFDKRVTARTDWFSQSTAQLANADIVFLDPDNGIQTSSVKATHTKSIKFALVDEVRSYCRHHHIVILYNHRDHSPNEEYNARFRVLHKEVGRSTHMRIIRFKRVSVRDYVFFYQGEKAPVIRSLFEVLGQEPYDFLFEGGGLEKP